MPVPESSIDLRKQALERAWTLAEKATNELEHGQPNDAIATAAVASTWATIAQVGVAIQDVRKK